MGIEGFLGGIDPWFEIDHSRRKLALKQIGDRP